MNGFDTGTCLPADSVPRAKRELAERAVIFFSRELGIDPPPLKWHKGARLTGVTSIGAPRDCVGMLNHDGSISLDARLEGDKLIETIAHEVKHAQQAKSDPLFSGYCRGARALEAYEREADRFAEDAPRRFFNQTAKAVFAPDTVGAHLKGRW